MIKNWEKFRNGDRYQEVRRIEKKIQIFVRTVWNNFEIFNWIIEKETKCSMKIFHSASRKNKSKYQEEAVHR